MASLIWWRQLVPAAAISVPSGASRTAGNNTRTKALRNLHVEYGFTTSEELIAAIKDSTAPVRGKPGPKPKAAQAGGAGAGTIVASKSSKRGKRAKITPEMKAQLKVLAKEGKTGNEIAKALGISLPSVQNIKKELGLVKARKN